MGVWQDAAPLPCGRGSPNTVRSVLYHGPYGFDRQNCFTVFFPGSWALHMQIFNSISRKINLEKIPPQGVRPPIFCWCNFSTPRAMCLQNFIVLYLELWHDDVCEHSKDVILALLRLRPRGQGSPAPKIFLHIFSWVRGMTHEIFQIEISTKNLGKNFPQGGLTPKTFTKVPIPPPGQCACTVSYRYL